VPSSTSNSDARLPAGAWGRTWLIAILLAGVTLGGLEGAWRTRGFAPSVTDDAALWALARGQASGRDPNQVVLLGASRMQLGVVPAILRERLGGREPLQLAIDGSSCVPVLDDLSRDPDFCGLVLVDVMPAAFYSGPLNVHAGTQAEYVRAYHEQTATAALETRLRLNVQSHIVFRHPAVLPTGRNLLRWTRRGHLPEPGYGRTLANRCRLADYTRVDVAKSAAELVDRTQKQIPPAPTDVWRQSLVTLREMVDRLHAHGARVVFLTLPVSGELGALEANRFPRAAYWNALLDVTGALGIHFRDEPALADFVCAEGSHLDYRDAARFTAELATTLQRTLACAPRPDSGDSAASRITATGEHPCLPALTQTSLVIDQALPAGTVRRVP